MLYEVAGCATAAIVAAFLLAAHFSARLAALEARRLESDLEGLRRAASEKDLTALVTGANSGIGFTLAKLLAQAGVRVFLGCRSAERGNAALARIRATTPAAKCELLLLDVSDPISVFGALRSGRLDVIDYVFLNAGIMPIAHYRWGAAIAATFLGRLRAFLEVGRATPMGAHFLAGPPDAPLAHACGAPSVFASNALGHAILLRQLAPRLREAAERRGTGRAVWTGSIAALPGPSAGGHFHWPRFEVPASGERGEAGGGGGCCAGESYGETKAAVDMLNVRGRGARGVSGRRRMRVDEVTRPPPPQSHTRRPPSSAPAPASPPPSSAPASSTRT